jgi:hypothetical protein
MNRRTMGGLLLAAFAAVSLGMTAGCTMPSSSASFKDKTTTDYRKTDLKTPYDKTTYEKTKTPEMKTGGADTKVDLILRQLEDLRRDVGRIQKKLDSKDEDDKKLDLILKQLEDLRREVGRIEKKLDINNEHEKKEKRDPRPGPETKAKDKT